jgi:hypothetical protein
LAHQTHGLERTIFNQTKTQQAHRLRFKRIPATEAVQSCHFTVAAITLSIWVLIQTM